MVCESLGFKPIGYPDGTESYWKLYYYGKKKTTYSWDQLIILGFMAGFWLSVWCAIATRGSGLFYDANDKSTVGSTNLTYGMIFPGGLIAIMLTSSELFTGNVAAMSLYLFHEWSLKALVDTLRVCLCSMVMNGIGGVFGALLFSQSSIFEPSTSQADWLLYLANKKLKFGFGDCLLLSVACNSVVCLTIFAGLQSDNFTGKLIVTWYLIAGFCWGGFEHLIANYFTIPCAMIIGESTNFTVESNIGKIFTKNWLPVALGNIIGGILFTSLVWWYTMRPAIQANRQPLDVDKDTRAEDDPISESEV